MIEMSEVRLYVTGDERLLRHVGVSDFLKPAWGLLRQRRINGDVRQIRVVRRMPALELPQPP